MPPKATRSQMEARVEPLGGSLPSISWRWDPETDILSGSFKGNRKSGGLTGTVELTDAEGSVAVLDVNNGVICGIDVVVWPEVSTRSDIQVPAQLDRRPRRPAVRRVARRRVPRSRWTPACRSRPMRRRASSTCGSAPAGRSRSCALPTTSTSRWTSKGRLAGFWMTNVPPFAAFEEE